MTVSGAGATVDTGWSWVVLFAMFCANAIHCMQVMSTSIFYPILLDVFGESRAFTSWYGSLSVILLFISGSLGSYLLPKVGARNVLFLSASFTSIAFIMTSLSNSLLLTIACYGILGGIGYGLFLTGGIAAIAQHFQRYQFTATSISIVGGGVGSLLYAPLLEWFIEMYGWRGAAMLFGGISLHLAVAASTVIPDRPDVPARAKASATIQNETDRNSCKHPCECNGKTELSDSKTICQCVPPAANGQPAGPGPAKEEQMRLLTVKERFSDVNFWCLVVVAIAAQLTISTYIAILKDVFNTGGLVEYFQVAVISAGICNTLIRILLAFLSFDNILLAYSLVLIFASVLLALFAVATQYWMFIAISGAMGMFMGAAFLMLPTSVGAVYGRKEMPITFGHVLFWVAIPILIGPPLIGYMRDSSGTYTSGLIFLAVITLLGAIVAAVLHLRLRRRKQSNEPV